MKELRIRVEQPDDHGAIAAVVADAFGSSAEARLVEAIRSSPEYIPDVALVAEVNGRIVGHVMISYATMESDGGPLAIAMLSPLAVAPDAQRRGIGAALEGATPHGIHITLPEWASPEAAQVVRLSRYDQAFQGRVVYPPAFDSVS